MSPLISLDFTDNLPDNLPRPSGLRLSIELVPKTATGINLRSELTPAQWDTLRHAVYAKANYCCEACGVCDTEVHCHEVWSYDDEKHIQKLIGLRCLCWECHETTHMANHGMRILEHMSTKHLARVNGITVSEADKIILEAYLQHSLRSKHEWTLDISWLDSYLEKEKAKRRDG